MAFCPFPPSPSTFGTALATFSVPATLRPERRVRTAPSEESRSGRLGGPVRSAEAPEEKVREIGRDTQPAEPSGVRHRVLVVDDHRDAADTLGDLLELWGHQAEVTYSGGEALERVRSFRPTAVLCNLGMPGMDGCEVARRLQQEPAAAGAVLIAITGYCRDEDRRRTREAGFSVHLAKPIDPEELLETLRAAAAAHA